LNRLTLVLSPTAIPPGAAPISRPILSAMRPGKSIQPASFQLRINPTPHSCSTIRATLPAVARGMAPSELPSR